MRHKFQWNFNQNTKLFSKENATENVVCAMFAILLRVLTCRLSETVMRMRMTFIANMGYSNRGRRPALSMTGTCRGETWWRHHMETHVTDPLCGESTGHRWSRVSKRPRQHLFIMRYKDELRWPRIWCYHYLPPGSLLTLGATESLSYSHVSFNLI